MNKTEKIPRHIAIIMDGNGRWAKERGLPRTEGHRAGVNTLKDIIKHCNTIGVEYLTVYSFSTENWKRPASEVSFLMDLLVRYLRTDLEELNRNNVQIRVLGDISELPETVRTEVETAVKITRSNNGLKLNVALNYGGRDEIVRAVRNLIRDHAKGEILYESIDEEMFSKYLYTEGIPDPDLVIRPSGEMRISNFLLWQIAYSELWFADCYWPDFTPGELDRAILDYGERERRFGGI